MIQFSKVLLAIDQVHTEGPGLQTRLMMDQTIICSLVNVSQEQL